MGGVDLGGIGFSGRFAAFACGHIMPLRKRRLHHEGGTVGKRNRRF